MVRSKKVPIAILESINTSLPLLVGSGDDFPVDVDDAVFDFYPLNVSEDDPREVDGLLVAVVKSIVEKIIKASEKAGIKLLGIDLTPFALTRALTGKDTVEDNGIILNVGTTTTSVTFLKHNKPVFVRFIPFGSDLLVESIQKLTGLEYDKSRELRNQIGVGSEYTDNKRKAVSNVINNETNTIYKNVRDTIKYYKEIDPDEYSYIIMVGGAVRIPGQKKQYSPQ